MEYQKIFFKSALLFTLSHNNLYAIENYGAYIPPMCYTKTQQDGRTTNPCYVCHTNAKEPNFFNELSLQQNYLFPKKMMSNPYKNLFKDRTKEIAAISDEFISNYIRSSNYTQSLQSKYECYFNFDDEGFDKDDKGDYTLWRAFVYRPFMGTFFPTNGSMDDVIIRLPRVFAQDINSRFSLEVYKTNLDAVVQNIQNKKSLSHYVGKASKIKADLGLYPRGTEFLHTVRYIDFKEGKASISKRYKELRYGKKVTYKNYAYLESLAEKEFFEEPDQHNLPPMQSYQYNAQDGYDNALGWYYKGYIEDRDGSLRLQTQEETLSCIGCHAKLAATVDSTFAMKRYVRWGYQTLDKLNDLDDEYKTYLIQNPTGNEYGTNDEVFMKFFHQDTSMNEAAFLKLSQDISTLLIPSYKRAMQLNKAYYLLVKEQSFIYGKDAPLNPINNIHEVIKKIDTGVKEIIINKEHY